MIDNILAMAHQRRCNGTLWYGNSVGKRGQDAHLKLFFLNSGIYHVRSGRVRLHVVSDNKHTCYNAVKTHLSA